MKPLLFLCVVVCLAPMLPAGRAAAGTVADEVSRLRMEDKDYAAAVELAQQYLDANPDLTLERQRVHYELGAALYAAKDYTAAAAAFRTLVTDYSMTTLDKTSETFVVDDAEFYVGVIEHYFGDRATGIEAYAKAIADFPKSNRRAQALMLLAGVYEQDGEKAKALDRFKQLVAEHPQSEQAPEAKLHVGHLLRADGKLDDAIAAFQRVAKDWPESKHAATALLNVNRALMEEEIRSAQAADSEDQIKKNGEAIQANVKLLLEKYGDSDETAQLMQDVINYYSSPYHWMYDKEAGTRIQEAVQWLADHKAETHQGMRAMCEYALMLGSERADEALSYLDWVSGVAKANNEKSLLFDAQFTKARVLRDSGKTDEARAIWTALLEQDPNAPTADELKIMLALLSHKEENYEDALRQFDEIASDPMRREDIRSTALCMMAEIHARHHRFEEAVELVDKIIAEYPDTLSATAAKAARPVWAELAKIPIEKRGKYQPR